MWYWFTNKLHEWLLFILVILVVGLIFFPEPTTNLGGYAASNVRPVAELALYFIRGVSDIAGGILDAMFS